MSAQTAPTVSDETLAEVLAEASALTLVYGHGNVIDQLLRDAEETHRYAADEDPVPVAGEE